MEKNILAHSIFTNVKELVNMSMMMDQCMKVNGIKVRRKVKEYIYFKMVQCIKVSLKMVKEMGKVKWLGQMVRSM